MRILLVLCVAVLASGPKRPTGIQESRFFKVDLDQKKVAGTLPRVAQALKLELLSVTTDQAQYWPNETVYLKVLAPGASGAFKATVQLRDSNAVSLQGTLDGSGIAVLTALAGGKKKLALGEYRIDVEVGAKKGSTAFSVVEGTLGALSFAYEFKKVTSADQLDQEKGAWFLGNDGGAGARWGNGLSFKNELRIDNKPYTGKADIHSRCMLPGCNGSYAGRSMTQVQIDKGLLRGTLEIGGHSGPFQIEISTDKGNLRHQFEGSSHVEREMITVSDGVSFAHRVGLAPYDKTTQIPGRQLFVESTAQPGAAFSAASIVAKSGQIKIIATKKMKAAVLAVYTPDSAGAFADPELKALGNLDKDAVVRVEVAMPLGLVTVGAFVDEVFNEGWLLAFRPGELQLDIDAQSTAAPKSTIDLALRAQLFGKGVAVSGILEAFDNRVAAKSALLPLGSAIGDTLRNAAQAVSMWHDNTGYPTPPEQTRRVDENQVPAHKLLGGLPKGSAKMLSGAGARPMVASPPAQMMLQAQGPGRSAAMPPQEEEVPKEAIREGEKKVVFCARVETDAAGVARVKVTLPPQTGRVTLRFVALKGFDHGSTERGIDGTKAASAELRTPRVFVPGASLLLPVRVSNGTQAAVTVKVSGAGVETIQKSVAPGDLRFTVAYKPSAGGTISALVSGSAGPLDRRDVIVGNIGEQSVTFSRLEIGGTAKAGPGETVVVYKNAGALMRGVSLNLFTTMESWFGHAEALSAKAAATAVLLAAIDKDLLPDDGMRANLIASVDKTLRDLEEQFVDAAGLVRPYPGLPVAPAWSGWVAKNMHGTAHALAKSKLSDARLADSLARSKALAERIDKALLAQGIKLEEQFAHNQKSQDIIAVEIDGKVLYKVSTDDVVTQWAQKKLLPALRAQEFDLSKALDTFRFLRAFERVGVLQYLTDIARALYEKGDMQSFTALYQTIARGMILAQEPGMLQGPALLGGVYSTPMALVRFLELQLVLAESKQVPTVARFDKAGSVRLQPGAEAFAKVSFNRTELEAGGELSMHIALDASRDPLEYAAIIAVPSVTSVKQSDDILSDYRGQLIYGQQALGSQQTQLLAVPFRGSRTIDLKLDAAYVGSSPGLVAIRHIDNPALVSTVATPVVTVRP